MTVQTRTKRKSETAGLKSITTSDNYVLFLDRFWDEKCAFTPESRIQVHEHIKKKRERQEARLV